MRFVRGGELFTHLRQVTRFPEERARFYAIQVAMALGHLHSKNIIYRDLKPENILMDEDGYVCLTDFGLAKVIEGNQQAFSFCGTPDYLAPEILVERGHSFPVDWWALGILTYEMIVGFPPFYTGQQNNNKMFELIKKKAVYFPDEQRHNISMSENCRAFISKVSININAKLIMFFGNFSFWRKIPQIVSVPAVDSRKYSNTLGLLNSIMKRSLLSVSRLQFALSLVLTSLMLVSSTLHSHKSPQKSPWLKQQPSARSLTTNVSSITSDRINFT